MVALGGFWCADILAQICARVWPFTGKHVRLRQLTFDCFEWRARGESPYAAFDRATGGGAYGARLGYALLSLLLRHWLSFPQAPIPASLSA
jgi:hypothetical protein